MNNRKEVLTSFIRAHSALSDLHRYLGENRKQQGTRSFDEVEMMLKNLELVTLDFGERDRSRLRTLLPNFDF